jgi:hypothetical protein
MDIMVFVLSSKLKININFVIHQFHAHLVHKQILYPAKKISECIACKPQIENYIPVYFSIRMMIE